MAPLGEVTHFTCSACGTRRKGTDMQVCAYCREIMLCRDCWEREHSEHDANGGK